MGGWVWHGQPGLPSPLGVPEVQQLGEIEVGNSPSLWAVHNQHRAFTAMFRDRGQVQD